MVTDGIATSAPGYSALQRALDLTRDPSLLSLALGLPAQELFPAAELAEAAASVLGESNATLQYGVPQQRLKSHVVDLMARRGVRCSEDEILLTTGGQQGLALLAQLLLGERSAVLTADAVYPGFRQALGAGCPPIRAVATGPGGGWDLAAAAFAMSHGPRPAFLYTMSVGHNPLSCNTERVEQERLLEFASCHALPVVEDDVYGFLQYDGVATAPLRTLETDRQFYVGSFSKILAPALRVGWIVGPAETMASLANLKEGLDINTGTLAQRIICRYLDTQDIAGRIGYLQAQYKLRRDAMEAALSRHLGALAHWRRPAAGFFFWVQGDVFGDAAVLLERVVERQRVAFVPGSAFDATGKDRFRNIVRLNFSHPSPDRIERGVAAIAEAVREMPANE